MKQILLIPFLMLLSILALPLQAQQEESVDPYYEGIEVLVNINQADAEELATQLVGVGMKKARLIVEYRVANGPFRSADDLANVSGIGAATIEKNRQRIAL